MSSTRRTLIGSPVYNEQDTVTPVLDRLGEYGLDVVAVDDGSTDRTGRLLAARGELTVLTHDSNQGYGKSLIDLFQYAIQNRYDWLITLDCDLQHDTGEIPRFLAAAEADDADVLSGTRYARHSDDPHGRPPADRLRINRLITDVLNVTLDLALTDAFCGFKAYRVEALGRLTLSEPGYAMPMQLWVQAVRRGLRIRELPVRLIYLDAVRHFGGQLDDTAHRLRHYLGVLLAALEAEDRRPARPMAEGAACR